MSKSTILSSGTINGADLLIELLEPADHPAAIRITWPSKPSIIQPSRFNQMAAKITRIVAVAATRYNQLKAQR